MSTAVQRQPVPAMPKITTTAKASWLIFLAAIVAVYGKTLVELVEDWWNNPDYSHGLIVPFAIGYLLWEKRRKLAAIPAKPVFSGLIIIVISQLFYLVGLLGSEFFVQRSSFLLLIAGTVLFFWGRKLLSECLFGLVLLQLSIPLPAILFNQIALPLQLLASGWAESALRICQVPVYREGNVLQLSTQLLSVTEACSGIRSLVSLITLAAMIAYVLPVRWYAKAILVASAFPIALGANAFRVAGTGLLGRYFGERWATGFFHTFEGWIVFLMAFGSMALLSALLQRVFPEKKEAVA